MLPWIFAVLVLLNAGLFLWGYQREKSLEPPPTPIPEGRYEIRLLTEPRPEPQRSVDGNHGDAQAQVSAQQERAADGPSEDHVAGSAGTNEPDRDSEFVGGEASGAEGESRPDETPEDTPGSGSTTTRGTPSTSDAQSSTSEAMHEQPLATEHTDVAPDSAAARAEMVEAEASLADEDAEEGSELPETGAGVVDGSKKPAELSRQSGEAPSQEEMAADAAPGLAEGEGTAVDELSE